MQESSLFDFYNIQMQKHFEIYKIIKKYKNTLNPINNLHILQMSNKP